MPRTHNDEEWAWKIFKRAQDIKSKMEKGEGIKLHT